MKGSGELEAGEVSDAARRLARAMRECEPEAGFAPCSPTLLADIARHLPLSPELELWYSTLAPAETLYVLQRGNNLRLCPPAELVEAQLGYRWGSLPDEGGGERFEEWEDDWVVIADIGADAIIAHVGLPGTPVFFSPHGEGEWNLSPLAPSLAAYLEALARWIEIALIGTGAAHERNQFVAADRIWDNDGSYQPLVATALRATLGPLIGEECLSQWIY
jgi:hypothetical protein